MPRFFTFSMLLFLLCGCVAGTPTTNNPVANGAAGLATATTNAMDIPSPTNTPTFLPSKTPTLLPTETPEVVFVPEGFQIGEMGLLRDPATANDVLNMNPEADWARVRQEIIGGLWEANVDWANYTGQGNDAVNYTKDAFIAAALQGKQFHIGIPVRLDSEIVPEGDRAVQQVKDALVTFEMVNIELNNIHLQSLVSDAFIQKTGKSWLDNHQRAYNCGLQEFGVGANACLFSVENGKLVMSAGSFYQGGKAIVTRGVLIGDFDPASYEEYPTYFRPDGLGLQADRAVSYTLGMGINELVFYSKSHYQFTGSTGETVKIISVGKSVGYQSVKRFVEPKLFIFKG
jgi:hypothetical protein